jgi:hypothetical protein
MALPFDLPFGQTWEQYLIENPPPLMVHTHSLTRQVMIPNPWWFPGTETLSLYVVPPINHPHWLMMYPDGVPADIYVPPFNTAVLDVDDIYLHPRKGG